MVLAWLIGFQLGRLALLIAKIMRHLGPKHPFVQSPGHPLRSGQILRFLVIFQQLFDDCRIEELTSSVLSFLRFLRFLLWLW